MDSPPLMMISLSIGTWNGNHHVILIKTFLFTYTIGLKPVWLLISQLRRFLPLRYHFSNFMFVISLLFFSKVDVYCGKNARTGRMETINHSEGLISVQSSLIHFLTTATLSTTDFDGNLSASN